MSAPRVGLIGPRRRRQGLGPFVARQLRRAGAEVVAILGTSEESVRAAREELGLDTPGYTDCDRMIGEQRLDALAILSPHPTHAAYLEAALRAGLACLCEKPLVWGGERPAAEARRLVAGFRDTGLPLFENCQLPYLLEDYDRLHPQARGSSLRSFAIRLSPITTGRRAITDALHHPLSLLQALAPASTVRLDTLRFEATDEGRALSIRFHWVRDEEEPPGVEVAIRLQQQLAPPRVAALAVNGFWAEREIRDPGYRMLLRAGRTTVPVVDPVERLVGDFVRTLQGVPAPAIPAADPHAIVQRMELLEQMVAAFDRAEDPT